jgi:hypothetical protein
VKILFTREYLNTFTYENIAGDTMAMSKKIMERKERERKEKIAELEKLAATGSGDAKKKLAKEKRKMR